MPSPDRCPLCAAALPAGAPAGLCPRCLLREAMDLGQPTAMKGPSQTWPGLDGRLSVEGFAGVATESPPVVLPGSPELAAPAATGRYEILGEIARGGMGAVLLGRDPALGRELAVKVLLADHRGRPAMVRRFVEEAQIGGQLQHPGVVPVYDVGVFADQRPYFAMKLVRGRTLAALLDGRAGPSEDLPRFVGIFESVCQAVAYAHAHKVIHRDLKPSNVMVGSFGEVQVMDWGLAKVLETGGEAEESGTAPGVRTARDGRPADASRDGSVLGTAAYMAPEQARGEVDRLDERCDVFALGGILCEILTGRPPFAAPSRTEALRLAAAGDTSDALARLDSCGADPQLLALARGCLETDAAARLRDAGEVARAMAAYLSGVQERVRAAELARVEAQARAEEERKRRRAELRLTTGLIAVFALGALGVATQWHRAERHLAAANAANAGLSEAQARTARARDQALKRLGLAIEAVDTFTTGVSEDFLLKEPQHAKLRGELLSSALAYYRKLQEVLGNDPDGSPAELAAAMERVAKLSSEVGSKPDALAVREEVVRIRERLAREHPGRRDGRLALARAQREVGRLLIELARPAEAERTLAASVATCESLRRDRGDEPEVLGGLAESVLWRGLGLRSQGRLAEAVAAFQRSADLADRVVRQRPDDADTRYVLARSLGSLGYEDFVAGRLEAAAGRFAQSTGHFDALVKVRPREAAFRGTLNRMRGGQVEFLMRQGRDPEVVRLAARAIADGEALEKQMPNVSAVQEHLAWWHLAAYSIHVRSNRTLEALREAQAARVIFERLAARNPDDLGARRGLGASMGKAGDALRLLGRPEEAISLVEKSVGVCQQLMDRNPGNPAARSQLIESRAVLAAIQFEARRPVDALREYRRAAELAEASTDLYRNDWYNLGCIHARIATLTGAGRGDAGPEPGRHAGLAVAALRRAVALGYRRLDLFRTDPDLESLRGRADFRELVMDIAFPDNPFAP